MWTPLDCAASRGWTKCAEALLDGDSPIDPTDRGKVVELFAHDTFEELNIVS